MEGTNCEYEAYQSFKRIGFLPRYVHVNELKRDKLSLEDFSVLFIPGGFSAGDYIRAGVIFAQRLASSSLPDLIKFSDAGKPIIGVCNGFQVLCELGFLPGYDFTRRFALSLNDSNRYECRYTYVKMHSKNNLLGEIDVGESYLVPVAHSEGKIIVDRQHKTLERLEEEGQIVMKYADPFGNEAGYPWNPNGSEGNIAALSNPFGNVLGLMPHPERLYELPLDSDRRLIKDPVLGKPFFESLRKYVDSKSF